MSNQHARLVVTQIFVVSSCVTVVVQPASSSSMLVGVNDIGRANDYRIQAVGINIVTLKQGHNTAGRVQGRRRGTRWHRRPYKDENRLRLYLARYAPAL